MAIAEKDMAEINDTELAELQRKAHAFDSDQGRLRKTQEDLEAERAKRIAAEARLGTPPAQSIPGFDPKAAEVFGEDGVAVLQTVLAPVLGKLDTIGRKFEERDTADAQATAMRAYKSNLDAKLAGNNLPGFATRLYDGDLAPLWKQFAEAHPSIRRAQEEGDVETVSDMVDIFILQNKERVAGGHSPSAVGGFSPTIKSEFSEADYRREMKTLQGQLDNLAITEAEYNAKADALYDRWVTAQEKAEKAASRYGLA